MRAVARCDPHRIRPAFTNHALQRRPARIPIRQSPAGGGRQTIRETAYHDIPIVVPTNQDFWMPDRLAETQSPLLPKAAVVHSHWLFEGRFEA
jgi:hypothetical protein